LLDIGETCHMNFRRDLFEELNENIDSATKFANGLSLKPMGIDTIKLKVPGFSDFHLHDALYLAKVHKF